MDVLNILQFFNRMLLGVEEFYFMDFYCRKRMFQFKVWLSCTKFSNVTCLVYNLNQVLPAEPNFVVLQTPEGNALIFFVYAPEFLNNQRTWPRW